MLDDYEYYIQKLRKVDKLELHYHLGTDIGTCPNGCSIYDEYDQKLGFQYCPICGTQIEWC